MRISVIDKLARKQLEVEPRQFDGRLLHQLPLVRTSYGDSYVELYVTEPAESSRVALYRSGTRVVEVLGSLSGLEHAPWTSTYLEGLIDVPFLNVTPGTRSGIIHDERYAALCEALGPLEQHLNALIAEQQRAEEEQASQQLMRAIQRAFREALLALPPEEYDWFDVHARSGRRGEARRSGENGKALGALPEDQVLAGRGRTRARSRATAPVLRARGTALRCRCLASGEHDCRERLPLFQSAAARSVQTPSDS